MADKFLKKPHLHVNPAFFLHFYCSMKPAHNSSVTQQTTKFQLPFPLPTLGVGAIVLVQQRSNNNGYISMEQQELQNLRRGKNCEK